MADRTEIAWCDATWNPIRGCTRITSGCVNCYAERMAARGLPGLNSPTTGEPFAVMTPTGPRWTGKVELIESQLEVPLHWKRPRRIFVNSISDTFHKDVPDEWIDRIFAVMALCPQHTFIVLTKRGERLREYLTNQPGLIRSIKWAELAMSAGPRRVLWKCHDVAGPDRYFFGYVPQVGDDIRQWLGVRGYLPHIHLGVSASTQADLDAQVPHLLATPAAVRFVSLEPLIEAVDLQQPFLKYLSLSGRSTTSDFRLKIGLDGVIVGGESGPGARPMHPDWARSIKDQCVAAGVPFFFKQWGEWGLDPAPKFAVATEVFPDKPTSNGLKGCGAAMYRVGKHRSGRLLDGREWNEFPGGLR